MLYILFQYTEIQDLMNNKYIYISGLGVDEDDSKAIIIWRKKFNINLKINNNFLEVTKTY